MAGGGRRFKMIRLGLSKLWEFSQSSWLQIFFLLGQPPAESKVSGSSLTDSFGPVKLQCSSSRSSSSSEFTSPCTFLPGHSFPLQKKEKERQEEEEEEKLGYRFQRTPETPGETKEKQRRDKRGSCELRVLFFAPLSSESTKMQRVLFFFLLFLFFYSAEFRKSFFSFILTFFSSLQGHPASTF